MLPMRLIVVVAALFLAVAIRAGGQEPRAIKHVVLVSVDGLAASYLDDPRANLPTLRKLAKTGAVAKGMITSFPSVTWPSHTSLVTGVQPAKHGVIGNSVWSRKLERALTYMRKALEYGFKERNKFMEDDDFKALHELPDFAILMKMEPRVL